MARIGVIESPELVWSTRANVYSSLHGVPKMEKRAKEARWRAKPTWYQLTTPAGERVAWQFVGKRADSFERYGG